MLANLFAADIPNLADSSSSPNPQLHAGENGSFVFFWRRERIIETGFYFMTFRYNNIAVALVGTREEHAYCDSRPVTDDETHDDSSYNPTNNFEKFEFPANMVAKRFQTPRPQN